MSKPMMGTINQTYLRNLIWWTLLKQDTSIAFPSCKCQNQSRQEGWLPWQGPSHRRWLQRTPRKAFETCRSRYHRGRRVHSARQPTGRFPRSHSCSRKNVAMKLSWTSNSSYWALYWKQLCDMSVFKFTWKRVCEPSFMTNILLYGHLFLGDLFGKLHILTFLL